MTALMLLVCRSDAKMQTVVGVGVCAVAAAFIARQIVTIETLGWLWASPLLVALLGYLIAWMHPESIQIGVLHGAFAPLARPIPLGPMQAWERQGRSSAIGWAAATGVVEEENADDD